MKCSKCRKRTVNQIIIGGMGYVVICRACVEEVKNGPVCA